MKNLLVFLILVVATAVGVAQKTTVQGVVIDEINALPLPNASVTVVRTVDSVLINFTRTGDRGHFSFASLDTGRYKLLVSYPDFLGYIAEFNVATGQKSVKLDSIYLLKNSELLREITIVDGSAIKFKGDTIQFIADSFKVSGNSNVEDLLKKLPGLSVNNKGEIQAYGEKVEKVFVDGEEFFGNDPTIATRNIQAKAIDKIQVFDKTSKMEELTGIPDDEKFKAINLTLKEEYKKGYFGKVAVGAGLDPLYYDESAMLQAYSGKSKFSLYGIYSNVGTTGLNFEQMSTYGGGVSGLNVMDDGVIMIDRGVDEDFSWDGRYDGEGLPQSIALGASYTTKLLKDKIRIGANIGRSDIQLQKTTTENSQRFTPDNSFSRRDTENTLNNIINNSAKINVEADIDSFTQLNYTFSGSLKDSDNERFLTSDNDGNQGVQLSSIERKLDSESHQISINNNANLTRKFKKKKRLLTLNAMYNVRDNETKYHLLSDNKYYSLGYNEVINQLQDRTTQSNNSSASATFTEPIGKNWVTQVNYGFNAANDVSDRYADAYDEATGLYTLRVDSLSNNFQYDIFSHGGGIAFAYNKDKAKFRIGSNVKEARYSLEDKIIDRTTAFSRVQFFPSLSYTYKFNRSDNFFINYNGRTGAPSITQIQPVRDNTNPLYQVRGNPDLKQSFTNGLSMGYHGWKMLTGESIWAYVSINQTMNKIVSNNYVDPAGVTVSSYQNTDGSYTGNGMLSYYFRKFGEFQPFSVLSYYMANNISYVNNVRSEVFSQGFTPKAGFKWSITDNVSTSWSYGFTYNSSRGGLVANAGNNQQHNFDMDLNWEISDRFEFNTEVEYQSLPSQANFGGEFSQCLWNADLDYFLTKDKIFVLSFKAKDILNQNKGISRYISSEYVSEGSYNTIQRYFYLQLTYHLKSKAK